MIEVRIPKEIKEYKEKLYAGLTLRQSLSVVAAVVICVPICYFGRRYVSMDILSWISLAVALPLGMVGFFKFNGMNFEQFMMTWFRFSWNTQKRPYQYLPIFYSIRNELLVEVIKQRSIGVNDQVKLSNSALKAKDTESTF